jgi:hypothetical protein
MGLKGFSTMFLATKAWYCSSHRLRKGSSKKAKYPLQKDATIRNAIDFVFDPFSKNQMEAIAMMAHSKSQHNC